MSEPVNRSRWSQALWWLPALLAFAVYAASLDGPFFFDDHHAIPENANLRDAWPVGPAMDAPPDQTLSGRPIVALTLAWNYALGGLDPWGYRAVNVLIHAVNALLLQSVLVGTLTARHSRPRLAENAARRVALVVTLLWAVHPLNTEAVAYVVQRTELLACLSLLVTLRCAIGAWRALDTGERGAAVTWTLAVLATGWVGVLTKEVAVVAPALALLLDRAAFSGGWGTALRRHAPVHLAAASCWLVLLAATEATNVRPATAGFGVALSPWHYLLTQAQVIAWYLRLCMWPHPLTVHYYWPIARSLGESLPHALLVVSLLLGAIYALCRNRLVGVAGAAFFLWLTPTSSIIPITSEVAAERRMYVPLAAVLAVVVGATWSFTGRRPSRAARYALGGSAIVLTMVAAVASWVRLTDFEREERIWEAAADAAGGRVPPAMNAEALALASAGKLAPAIDLLTGALRVDPDAAELRVNRGVLLARAGRVDESLRDFEEALRLSPGLVETHLFAAVVLSGAGRTAEAEAQLERLLALRPAHPRAAALLEKLRTPAPPAAPFQQPAP